MDVGTRAVRPESVLPDGERSLLVEHGHGSLEELDHIDVTETSVEVRVRVLLRYLPEVAARMGRGEIVLGTLQLILKTETVQLSEPLGARRIETALSAESTEP
ncbi:MAG TPA: hypothetical protein VNG13_00760 [Mycobacteriales bacterium]|nr:hypothetical protein [Mycobacteriales bacterium]